jgi:multisubunit Na+/H+ antiporter MnhC subunit
MRDRRPSARGRAAYDGVTRLLAVVMVVLGALLVVRGELLAVIVGLGLIGAGLGRLWILARLRGRR